MAKNDTILLDGIIDDRVDRKLPSARRDEAFEYLSFEQALKEYDLSFDEIDAGSIDGRDDGGIDGFFVFVNGHLLQDCDSFFWPRTGGEIDVWLFTCKHHDTFKQVPLDKLNASIYELLDLSKSNSELNGSYSDELLEKRSELLTAYRKLSPRLQTFNINYVYASRGDSTRIGNAIKSRANQLVSATEANFSDCKTKFNFIGSTELVSLYRQRPEFSLELPFTELLSKGENYILLSELADYYEFVSHDGQLRRYLFDSNVRDFMGLNRVNSDIRSTLADGESPDFWWLNNGVTILASGASVVGKSIKLSDIQIVNGLQTTESIYRHFSTGRMDPSERALLVKVIVSNDKTERDAIIRSTNNQTEVEQASLHATDKIQRDIEDVLYRNGLYYERRKNYYINLGRSTSQIVTPLNLSAAFVATALRNPQQATKLRSRFMRNSEAYDRVFSESVPITFWPVLGQITKAVDTALERKRPRKNTGEHFLKGWRYLTLFGSVASHFGTFNYSDSQLYSLHYGDDLVAELEAVLDVFWDARDVRATNKQWTKWSNIERACRALSRERTVGDIDSWLTHGRRNLHGHKYNGLTSRIVPVGPEFVDRVNQLLPVQPWKPGVHINVMKELGCTKDEYFSATAKLIETGRRYRQRDGVVYDVDGHIIRFDRERVDPNTMKLFEH